MSSNFEQQEAKKLIEQAIYDWAERQRSDEPGYVGGVSIRNINLVEVNFDSTRSLEILPDGIAQLDPNYSLQSFGNDILTYSGTPPQQQKLRTHKFSVE